MTQDEITKIAEEAGLYYNKSTFVWTSPMATNLYPEGVYPAALEAFAELVAEAERKVMQAKIETLYAMYELATKQRDYLMDQQSAQVAAMRGRVQ